MTTYDVIAAARRRWYVLALCLMLAAGLAYTLKGRPGVYMMDVEAYFVAPPGRTAANQPPPPPNIGGSDAGLISLAGLVERHVNAGVDVETPVSPDVTIVGLGVRHGTLVTLPNAGGQWNYNFTRPMLKVQAAGPTSAEVERLYSAVIEEIYTTLDRLQAEDGVPESRRVTLRLVPEQPTVSYQSGFPTRAAFVAEVLGLALSLLACVLVDRLILSRRARRRARSSSSEQQAAPATVA